MNSKISFFGVDNEKRTHIVDYGAKEKDLVYIPLLYEEPIDDEFIKQDKKTEVKNGQKTWEKIAKSLGIGTVGVDMSKQLITEYNNMTTEIKDTAINTIDNIKQVKDAYNANLSSKDEQHNSHTDQYANNYHGIKGFDKTYDDFEAFDEKQKLEEQSINSTEENDITSNDFGN